MQYLLPMKLYTTLALCFLGVATWAQNSYEVTNLKHVNTADNEISPSIYGKSLVFCSDRGDVDNTCFQTALDKGDAINMECPKLQKSDSSPSFTGSGDIFFFMRQNDGGKSQILQASKNTTGWLSNWTTPLAYPEYNVGYPCLSSDGTVLYFASDMPGGFGGWDLYVSYFDGRKWSPAMNLGEKVNSRADEIAPFYDNNQQLFFSSNGHDTHG